MVYLKQIKKGVFHMEKRNRKKTLAVISAALLIMLSGCEIEDSSLDSNYGDVTVPDLSSEETTVATPTEKDDVSDITDDSSDIDEPVAEEPDPDADGNFYELENPHGAHFDDTVEVSDEVYAELQQAVRKISDARVVLYANTTGLASDLVLAESDEIYEDLRDEYDEAVYYKLNTEIATNEEELEEYIRSAFTEEYLSAEEIRSQLYDHPYLPDYKSIDGELCILSMYKGVMTDMRYEEIGVMAYDGNSAMVEAVGSGVTEPSTRWTLKLVYGEEYGWQLDALEDENYFCYQAGRVYNAVKLREDTLNEILGGRLKENGREIEVDGIVYAEADVSVSIDEMKAFFGEMFAVNSYSYDVKDEMTVGDMEAEVSGMLRDEYIQKYIDNVYCEQDGVLYRKKDEPAYYLPSVRLSTVKEKDCFSFGSYTSSGDYRSFLGYCVSAEFEDTVTGEIFTADILYKEGEGKWIGEVFCYDYVKLASPLPIRTIDNN